MKNIYYLFIIPVVLLQILTGCKSDTNNPVTGQQEEVNKIVFNGSGYNNASAQPYLTFAAYLSTLNMTGISFYCTIGTDTLTVLIYTPGQTNGTYPWSTALIYAVLLRGHSTTYRNSASSGTTTITSYGSVGQNIQGHFDGKVNNQVSPYDTINVSCSNFSVLRSTSK
jgi:hypothetical protein